jgi:hypothetical protein
MVGQSVTFNRQAALPASAERIPESVTTDELTRLGISSVQVQWKGLDVPQFHQPRELTINE